MPPTSPPWPHPCWVTPPPTASSPTCCASEPDGATVVRFVFRLPLLATTDQAGGLARTLNLNTADNHGAILLAICDPADDAHAGALLDALRNSLHGAGIPVTRRLLTRTVTVASYWIDVDTGDSGPTYPYTDSELAATAVSQGQRIAPLAC